MKKQLAILILSSLIPAAAMAADNFTGASVGAEVETTKYKVGSVKGEQMGAGNLKADYGFNMGGNFVGAVEAKAKVNKNDAFEFSGEPSIEQKDKYSVGYTQGYRVTKDLMPYAKAEYINSKFQDPDWSERMNGYGVGVGAKYNVAQNVEFGAEYVHSRLKSKDSDGSKETLKGNTVSAGVSYRFK